MKNSTARRALLSSVSTAAAIFLLPNAAQAQATTCSQLTTTITCVDGSATVLTATTSPTNTTVAGAGLVTSDTTGASITTYVATVDLGRWNTIVALSIAVTKMMLVLLYFMHLRYSHGLTRVVVLASFMFLALLIGITLTDALTREWTPSPEGWGSSSATLPGTPSNP